MSLFDKVISLISATEKNAGLGCFKLGAVEIVEQRSDWLQAEVTERARRYIVALAREAHAVTFSCECRTYQQTLVPCRHVYATILAASERKLPEEWNSPELTLIAEDRSHEAAEPRQFDPWKQARATSIVRLPREQIARRREFEQAEAWKKELDELGKALRSESQSRQGGWPSSRQILYVVDAQKSLQGNGLSIEVGYRELKPNGDRTALKHEEFYAGDLPKLKQPADREIIGLLIGATGADNGFYYGGSRSSGRYRLVDGPLLPLVRRMCQTGRCFLRYRTDDELLQPLEWDEQPWALWLRVARDDSKARYVVRGELRRGADRMALDQPSLMTGGGLIFWRGRAAPLDDAGAFAWAKAMRESRELSVPLGQREELLKRLLSQPALPPIDVPAEMAFERVSVPPGSRLKVSGPNVDRSADPDHLVAELSFDYGGTTVPWSEPTQGVYQSAGRRLIARDLAAEEAAVARLLSLGVKPRESYSAAPYSLEVATSALPTVVRALTGEGWQVEAEGKLYRQPGEVRLDVRSGIDWFELHGTADFGGQSLSFPQLLAALRKGEKTVALGDGTFGVLPETWLQKYGLLAGVGESKEDHLRFRKNQAGLLNAMLAAHPQATWDDIFGKAREALESFDGIRPADPPASFVGQLRDYQKEGLGWMHFLRKLSFGGCLADDMGLGKTVQVLAMLDERLGAPLEPGAEQSRAPSLVVAPRSLIFNWRQEAEKFTPRLRVLDHTGPARSKSIETIASYDLVLTTYGTLRNDIAMLREINFDCVVLDEAQAIKNASSDASKAARLLRGRQRLVLSGTPIQNHLGELWSLFEFLNPGMLGSASAFAGIGPRTADEASRTMLSRALRPFLLRRTKSQVARELPARVEQTIHCELDPAQRQLYDELKEHYRQSLAVRIESDGINKSKIHVLEALLRLRQAACHPGLLDKSKTSQGSAKLDALIAQLEEVLDEGHKALVFSQFTSFLAIVRERLDRENVTYAYLDGQTRDRQEVVERFQNDPGTKLMLISLKAGGMGLNLTAAEYVFLLDPWWNPAVEAQAIDRAHRIGQANKVFAYRLIASNTVEEKVLQLQETKRDLADAILSADNSLISKLGKEDLELLLS